MKVAVVGTGLIGGSVALGLEQRSQHRVAAWDPDPGARATLAGRLERGTVEDDLAAAVGDADLVFLCAPVSAIPELAEQVAPLTSGGCVLTDVGSTKAKLVLEVEGRLRGSRSFIGGHPMAGSEEAGPMAAREDLFEGAAWLLTPTAASAEPAYERVQEVLLPLGARIVSLDPASHDRLMASISHLPQLLATALMQAATEELAEPGLLSLAGRGFRDMTRLAASNPAIWVDICEQNAEAITASLKGIRRRLDRMEEMVERGDRDAIEAMLSEARTARRAFRDKPTAGDLHEILVVIPDRPGVLAQVTTTVGALGINIEDLSIAHGVNGERGLLTLVVTGDEAASSAVVALESQGLIAESRQR